MYCTVRLPTRPQLTVLLPWDWLQAAFLWHETLDCFCVKIYPATAFWITLRRQLIWQGDAASCKIQMCNCKMLGKLWTKYSLLRLEIKANKCKNVPGNIKWRFPVDMSTICKYPKKNSHLSAYRLTRSITPTHKTWRHERSSGGDLPETKENWN